MFLYLIRRVVTPTGLMRLLSYAVSTVSVLRRVARISKLLKEANNMTFAWAPVSSLQFSSVLLIDSVLH